MTPRRSILFRCHCGAPAFNVVPTFTALCRRCTTRLELLLQQPPPRASR